MKKIWDRITLMQYANDEDDGRIGPDKVLGTVVTFLAICGAYLIACALVRG